jgi:hypothetical protein
MASAPGGLRTYDDRDYQWMFHQSFHRAYRLAMSTKHIETAADLVRFGASTKVDCGAARTLSGTEVVKGLRTRQPKGL